jgi:hypoxia up-regulated 1
VLCFLLLFVGRSVASVLAVDYGTEWTKAALVKAGIPMQIVLTKDSKRKEQSTISFKNQDERVYGTDGFNLVPPPEGFGGGANHLGQGARYPDAMFPSLKGLLGRSIESDVVKRFLREHPSIQTTEGDRSSLTFQLGESTYTVEELVAMQLVNIKLQAEKMADETVKDLILTVPVYWTEQERKALINAAELAGMKVSSLINDGLAGTPTIQDFIDCKWRLITGRRGCSLRTRSTI